jgi:CRISPR-associated endonuclease Cas1
MPSTARTPLVYHDGSAVSGTLNVFDPAARLTARGGRLLVETCGATHALVIADVREVHVHTRASVSSGARALLLENGIDMVFFDGAGRLAGRLTAHSGANVPRRLAQLRAQADPERRLALAKAFVSAKLLAQESELSRARCAEARAARRELAGARARVADAPSLDVLRGIEGAAAARTFAAFGARVRNPDFAWRGRSHHPARDGINAALSYGYALATGAVESAVLRASLDPLVGFLHESHRGNAALVWDLVEEHRPRVERLVLELVNRRELRAEHCWTAAEEAAERARAGEEPDDPMPAAHADIAVRLRPEGRRRIVQRWREALAEPLPHPVTGALWERGDLIAEQATRLATSIGVEPAAGGASTWSPLHATRERAA